MFIARRCSAVGFSWYDSAAFSKSLAISTSAWPRIMRACYSRAACASRDIASCKAAGMITSRISTDWTVTPHGFERSSINFCNSSSMRSRPRKRSLNEVQNYPQAVSWAAQTALRDIIGRTSLTALLRGREKIEEELQKLIDERSNPWGVTVQSVEMRDVIIPDSLQDAMSREAQASREKAARIILGEAEVEIAKLFQTASISYHDNPTALHLRAMNMLYEGLKEKGAMMIVPSTAVESMGMGGLMGMAAQAQRQLTESATPSTPTA